MSEEKVEKVSAETSNERSEEAQYAALFAKELAKGRDLAREQTWCNIGKGAEKTADYLIAKHEEIVRKEKEKADAAKPANTRRKSTKKLFA